MIWNEHPPQGQSLLFLSFSPGIDAPGPWQEICTRAASGIRRGHGQMFTLDGLVALLEISRVCGAKEKKTTGDLEGPVVIVGKD